MTLHAVRPAGHGLADLHRARAEVALTIEKRQGWNRLGSVAVSVFQGVLWFRLNDGGRSGLIWGSLAFLGFLLICVLGEVLGAYRDRRSKGPAGPGPSSLGEVTTRASGHDISVAVHAAFAAQGFSGSWFVDSNTVEAWVNDVWGGRRFVTVRVLGAGESLAVVTVWAHPDLTFWAGWGVNDGGRCRKIANAVLRAIPGGHESVREPGSSSQA